MQTLTVEWSSTNVFFILQKLPEENDQKAVECESTKNTVVPLPKNQDKLPTDKSNQNNTAALTNGDLALKKKKKYKKRHITDDTEVVPKKKGRTVKILLEEKRVLDSKCCSFCSQFYRIIHVGDFTAETLLLKHQPTLHST